MWPRGILKVTWQRVVDLHQGCSLGIRVTNQPRIAYFETEFAM
jgi:hypothetical protein